VEGRAFSFQTRKRGRETERQRDRETERQEDGERERNTNERRAGQCISETAAKFDMPTILPTTQRERHREQRGNRNRGNGKRAA
jgi:hypothetical protein